MAGVAAPVPPAPARRRTSTPTSTVAGSPAGSTPTPVWTTGSPTPVQTTGSPTPVQTTGSPTPIQTTGSPTPIQTTGVNPGGCSATYSLASDWGNGFVANVTVTNSGSRATAGWKV